MNEDWGLVPAQDLPDATPGDSGGAASWEGQSPVWYWATLTPAPPRLRLEGNGVGGLQGAAATDAYATEPEG